MPPQRDSLRCRPKSTRLRVSWPACFYLTHALEWLRSWLQQTTLVTSISESAAYGLQFPPFHGGTTGPDWRRHKFLNASQLTFSATMLLCGRRWVCRVSTNKSRRRDTTGVAEDRCSRTVMSTEGSLRVPGRLFAAVKFRGNPIRVRTATPSPASTAAQAPARLGLTNTCLH